MQEYNAAHCFNSLLCKNCTIEEIPTGLTDLELEHSTVGSIDQLRYGSMYSKYTFTNSTINDFSGVVSVFMMHDSTLKNLHKLTPSQTILIVSCHIENIHDHAIILDTSAFNLMSMNTIDNVGSFGLQVENGRLGFSDVHFKNVSRYGLVFNNNEDVRLTNITIDNCQYPCVLINHMSDFSDINKHMKIKNLTINGNRCDHITFCNKYIRVADDWTQLRRESVTHLEHCLPSGNTLYCDFSDVQVSGYFLAINTCKLTVKIFQKV